MPKDEPRYWSDKLDKPTYDELFRVLRCARYHSYRRRFYENWNALAAALAALAGTASASLLLSNAQVFGVELPGIVLLISGITSAIVLALNMSSKAALHAELAIRYTLLQRHFASYESLPEQALEVVRNERFSIEGAEPPILRLLDVVCHFEVWRSLGGNPAKVPKVGWFKRRLMHYASMPSTAHALQLVK